MTGIRQSFIIGREALGYFGKGPCADSKWVAPPPGSYFNSTHNRSTSRIQSTGSKRWDTVAYGSLTGQWDWTFNLDYKYLTPLLFVFENFDVKAVLEDGTEVSVDSPAAENAVGYYYNFSKMDTGRIPSFCVRRKILNYMTGGPVYSDEVVELRGCVCKSFRFTKSDSTSQISVTMTGFYADEKMVTGELDSTDFQTYEGNLVEWMCMYVADQGDDYKYVANTDNLGVSIENNANAVYTVCSPFAKTYFEGLTNYSFNTSCYSTDPDQYKKRLYYGGYKGWTGSTKESAGQPLVARPIAKGMRPIPKIKLVSYSGSVRPANSSDEPPSPIADVIKTSDHRLELLIDECVIKSMTWPKGNGGKLQDSISSAECKEMSLKIFVKGDYLEFDPVNADVIHQVTSSDPVADIIRQPGCVSGQDPTD